MNSTTCYTLRALRRCSCRTSTRLIVPRSAVVAATTFRAPACSASYQSYALPTSPPKTPARSDDIPNTSIAQPEPVPKEHQTRRKQPEQQREQQQSSAQAGQRGTTPQVPEQEAQKPKPVRPQRKLRARKAAMKLTPAAVEQLSLLLDQPEPKMIKVGVRNRGCSGLAYHLEYVDKPAAFDETVEQDGVKVLIDSKALFSIIGSEMDFVEDKLNQRFVFKNPNIKEECGCGESFMV